MNWNQLNTPGQLAQIDRESLSQPVLILKHSTRCSISSAAWSRIERKWSPGDEARLKPYFLDLLAYRDISNEIEAHYQVEHQSPQVLIIKNGSCIYMASHMEINYDDLLSAVR